MTTPAIAEQVYQIGLWTGVAYSASARFIDTYRSDTFNMGIGIAESGRMVVACAGSKDVRDFIDDATAIPVHVPELDCMLHAGFVEGYLDAFAWLRSRIAAGACGGIAAHAVGAAGFNNSIDFGGHSLGGPHANLMATLAAKAGLPVGMLVMLETPRPGFAAFRDLSNRLVKPIYSFVNGRDWVPDLPPEALGWCHVAPLIRLDHPGADRDLLNGGIDPDHMLDAVLPGLKAWRDAQLAKTMAA